MTEAQAEYQEYLLSDHWRELRYRAVARDVGRCRSCGTMGRLEVHHIFYRRRWEDSRLEDLISLCPVCHKRWHEPIRLSLVARQPVPVVDRRRVKAAAAIGKRRWDARGRLLSKRGIPISVQGRAKVKSRKKWLKKFRKRKLRLDWSF